MARFCLLLALFASAAGFMTGVSPRSTKISQSKVAMSASNTRRPRWNRTFCEWTAHVSWRCRGLQMPPSSAGGNLASRPSARFSDAVPFKDAEDEDVDEDEGGAEPGGNAGDDGADGGDVEMQGLL